MAFRDGSIVQIWRLEEFNEFKALQALISLVSRDLQNWFHGRVCELYRKYKMEKL